MPDKTKQEAWLVGGGGSGPGTIPMTEMRYSQDGVTYTAAEWALKRQLDRIIQLLETIAAKP